MFDIKKILKEREKMNKRQRAKNSKKNVIVENAFTEQNLLDLAMIYFSINKYANKLITENNLKDKARPLQSNIAKIVNFLANFKVEIIDYAGHKFNDSLNIDIIDTIKSDTKFEFISETIEPSIIINQKLVKKAKIIKEIPKK